MSKRYERRQRAKLRREEFAAEIKKVFMDAMDNPKNPRLYAYAKFEQAVAVAKAKATYYIKTVPQEASLVREAEKEVLRFVELNRKTFTQDAQPVAK